MQKLDQMHGEMAIGVRFGGKVDIRQADMKEGKQSNS
jgi:hypothetical protein